MTTEPLLWVFLRLLVMMEHTVREQDMRAIKLVCTVYEDY
jgi:hypothetical protein